MRKVPQRMVEIQDLISMSNKCVRVLLKNGMRVNLPRDYVEFVPRAVMVPEWLWKKLYPRGARHENAC